MAASCRGESSATKAASGGDDGRSACAYAVGLIAAVAFAGILYKVVTSGTVLTALTTIVKRALSPG